MTVLMALSSIAVEQTKAKEKNYGMLHSTAGLPHKQFRGKGEISRVDMIMNIHSDALCLSKTKARSRACGHFSWDGCPRTGNP
jgi:hypothetical protein